MEDSLSVAEREPDFISSLSAVMNGAGGSCCGAGAAALTDLNTRYGATARATNNLCENCRAYLVTPATSTWCRGLVLRPGGSQAPALCPVRQDGGGQEADGYQRGSMQHHRHSGVNEVGRILPCTCGCATLDARRILLLVSGDVERNPGPMIRGAQWNDGGLSQAKRIALERKLHEDMVLFCPLQETHQASAECAALKIGGYQHVGQARTPNEGGV
ncbi:unnamed protein product, partial [Trypanosoma congolense IL3000]